MEDSSNLLRAASIVWMDCTAMFTWCHIVDRLRFLRPLACSYGDCKAVVFTMTMNLWRSQMALWMD